MEIKIERHLQESTDLTTDGYFQDGIANSAIAGKCGNGGSLPGLQSEWMDAPQVDLPSVDELLAERDKR